VSIIVPDRIDSSIHITLDEMLRTLSASKNAYEKCISDPLEKSRRRTDPKFGSLRSIEAIGLFSIMGLKMIEDRRSDCSCRGRTTRTSWPGLNAHCRMMRAAICRDFPSCRPARTTTIGSNARANSGMNTKWFASDIGVFLIVSRPGRWGPKLETGPVGRRRRRFDTKTSKHKGLRCQYLLSKLRDCDVELNP
jgi:hypothetical protein